MIEVGDEGRWISLEGVKNDLIDKTITLLQYCAQIGFKQDEVEDIELLISGEIEQCQSCNKWKHAYDITVDNNCFSCEEEPNWLKH